MLSQSVHCIYDSMNLTHIWLLKVHHKLLSYAFEVKVMFIVSIQASLKCQTCWQPLESITNIRDCCIETVIVTGGLLL